MTHQIIGRYFHVVVEVTDEKVPMVVAAPPILAWAVGRTWWWVRDYCEARGWLIAQVVEAMPVP